MSGNGILRTLRLSDIPDLMRLKEAAGWNQTEQDWVNVMAVEPQGCFGIELDGLVVSSATAVCYRKELAWIGMVLTAPEFRGRGFARRLMERSIDHCRERGVEWIKLDGTDMGVPLYRRLGFVDESPVERWLRPSDAAPIEPIQMAPLGSEHLRLDREAFGADRSGILEKVAVEAASIRDCGYGMGRPGTKAAYFGPCVTPSKEAARNFLRWFIARHPGEGIFWDLLPDTNKEAVELAREFGFEPRRRLIRMALPATPDARPFINNDCCVFAIAGFEYG